MNATLEYLGALFLLLLSVKNALLYKNNKELNSLRDFFVYAFLFSVFCLSVLYLNFRG
jgi:hypothetical protein